MQSGAPDSSARAQTDDDRVRELVAAARACLTDTARRVARAGLEARADARVLKIFAEAVALTEVALERALESLAEPH